jgi:putative sterol carrier protein
MADEAFVLGSREWFETSKKKLSEDEDLKAGIANWQGKMRCIIDCEDELALQDYSSEDGVKAFLSMLDMLSTEDRAKFKGTGVDNIIQKIGFSLDDDPSTVGVAAAAKVMAGLTVDDFKDFVFYASFWPDQGVMKGFDPIAPDAYLDAPFTLAGKYTAWKQLCSGQQSAIQLIMGGKMKLQGDLKYIMKRMAAMNALVEVYKSIPLK